MIVRCVWQRHDLKTFPECLVAWKFRRRNHFFSRKGNFRSRLVIKALKPFRQKKIDVDGLLKSPQGELKEIARFLVFPGCDSIIFKF
jgi:hypothetical protein